MIIILIILKVHFSNIFFDKSTKNTEPTSYALSGLFESSFKGVDARSLHQNASS
jgi:hypothetical protein